MKLRMQLLPADLLEVDAGAVEGLQESGLLDELEWLHRKHLEAPRSLNMNGSYPAFEPTSSTRLPVRSGTRSSSHAQR